MTAVRVDLTDHRRLPVLGQMTWAPHRRLVATDHVVLPDPVAYGTLGTILAPYTVDLTPTDDPRYPGPWCYTVTEPGRGTTRHVLVPTRPVGTVLQYAALTDVDPATLAPTATPPPAWDGRIALLEQRVTAFAEATGAAPAFFVHTQTTPASTWAVAHPLGRYPGVEVYVAATTGAPPLLEPVGTDVTASTTHVYVTWRAPMTGTVVLT